MKKITLLLVFGLAVAAAVTFALYPRASPPEKALTRMLESLYDGKPEEAEERTLSGLGLDYDGSRRKKLFRAMWKTMRYTIMDAELEEDASMITVSITMVDMDALLDGLTDALLESSLSGERGADRRLYNALLDRVRSGEEAELTTSVTVLILPTPDGWRVDAENSSGLVSAITGDLY